MRKIKLRYPIVLMLVILILPVFRSTHKTYFYSDDGKHCLTVIQKHNIFDLSNRGFYLIDGKFKGKSPKDNYVFIKGEGHGEDFFYRWLGDTLCLRLPYWEVKDNKLNPNNTDFINGISKEDAIKYDFSKISYNECTKNMESDYYRIKIDYLEQNWKTWWNANFN